MKKISLNLLPIFGLLCSCAVVSKKDCSQLDWTQKAEEEVLRRADWQKKLAKYDKVCSKHGFDISEDYLRGVQSKGGAICTGFRNYKIDGWNGVGKRDALSGGYPDPEKYSARCSRYNILVDVESYNYGVKSVGAEACSSFSRFNQEGWSGVGKRDAKAGYKNNKNSYVEICREHYFTEVKVQDFMKGYSLGIKEFCTKKSGYKFGEDGKEYQGTCPQNERQFLFGYKIGQKVQEANVLESELRRAKDRVIEISGSIKRAHDDIDDHSDEIRDNYGDYITDKRRLESDIDDLRERLFREEDPDQKERYRSELVDLRDELSELDSDLSSEEESLERRIDDLRLKISKLREERDSLDRQIPGMEESYRSLRAYADKGLERL